MSWTTPRVWIPGQQVSAAQLNVDIKDNATALRTGSLALASQATNDFLYASSATQLGRLAAVEGKGPKVSGGVWTMAAFADTPYAVTPANAVTSGETTIATFSIPAAEMADGDILYFWLLSLEKNNSGAPQTITFKVNVGTGAQVTLGAPTLVDSATEYKTLRGFVLGRVGADAWIYDGVTNGQAQAGAPSFDRAPSAATIEGVSTPANWTGANTVSLKATLTATHASFYTKPQFGRAWRQGN